MKKKKKIKTVASFELSNEKNVKFEELNWDHKVHSCQIKKLSYLKDEHGTPGQQKYQNNTQVQTSEWSKVQEEHPKTISEQLTHIASTPSEKSAIFPTHFEHDRRSCFLLSQKSKYIFWKSHTCNLMLI